jgi:hypothetical protein
MKKYITQSEATRTLAAQQTHDDLRPGPGVITMPTHEDIAKRAYGIYVKSGCEQGKCKRNWHQAEHELRTGGRRP